MQIIGHRGASGIYPENTLAAFRGAWEAGAHGVELDVQASADGRLVVFHDRDGWRLAGVDQKVSKCSWEEIHRWKIRGENVALLEEVLTAAPVTSLVMVEVKEVAGVHARAIRERLMLHRGCATALLTFERDLASRWAAGDSSIPVFLNADVRSTGAINRLVRFASLQRLAGLSLSWTPWLGRDAVAAVHDAGLRLAVWTVNDEAQANRALDIGVDILMTDDPGRILANLGMQ